MMTPPSEPDRPKEPSDEHLAELLEACLRAERALPDSSVRIVQSTPEHLRPELAQLLALGQKLWSLHGGELARNVRQELRARLATGSVGNEDRATSRRRVSWALQALWRWLL